MGGASFVTCRPAIAPMENPPGEVVLSALTSDRMVLVELPTWIVTYIVRVLSAVGGKLSLLVSSSDLSSDGQLTTCGYVYASWSVRA